MRVPKKAKQPLSSLDVADIFALKSSFTPAMPSQRESQRHALRLLAGIAVRMSQPGSPLPPRDLTSSPTEAMNDVKGRN